MSVSIELFDFSKRKNSTKVPAGAGTVVDANIKSDCSFYEPSFEIAMVPNLNFNYCKFDGKYYFLTDKRVTANNYTELDFTLDFLGTYKANVLATTSYVLYDTHSNVDIPDDRVPTSKDVTITSSTTSLPFQINHAGKFIMTVVNGDGVVWWDLTPVELRSFLADVQTWTDNLLSGFTPNFQTVQSSLETICNFFTTLFKQISSSGNVMDNVKSVVWLPLDSTTGNTNIKVGNYTSNVMGIETFFSQPLVNTVTVSIPWQFSDWRNKNEYTSVYLYLPFVGVQSLVADNLIGISNLSIDVSLDYKTGDLAYLVHAGGEVIGAYKGNISVTVPVGAITQGSLGGITTGAFAGATFASKMAKGNSYVMAGSILAGEILGKAKTTNSTSLGALSGNAGTGLDLDIHVFVESNNTLYNPHDLATIKGEPRHANMLLSNCSGYVQTSGAQVDVATTDSIRQALNVALDSGIYLE